MSRFERDKGARGEREVAGIFRTYGFDCDRVPNSGGLRIKGDLYGNVPAHVEVKWQERCQIWEWWAQAAAEAPNGAPPVVAFRRSRSPWLALVPLDFLAGVLSDAGEVRAARRLLNESAAIQADAYRPDNEEGE